jgi:hypothetical protein
MYLATWLGATPGLSVHDRAEDAAAAVTRKTGIPAVWFYSANLARLTNEETR